MVSRPWSRKLSALGLCFTAPGLDMTTLGQDNNALWRRLSTCAGHSCQGWEDLWWSGDPSLGIFPGIQAAWGLWCIYTFQNWPILHKNSWSPLCGFTLLLILSATTPLPVMFGCSSLFICLFVLIFKLHCFFFFFFFNQRLINLGYMIRNINESLHLRLWL